MRNLGINDVTKKDRAIADPASDVCLIQRLTIFS